LDVAIEAKGAWPARPVRVLNKSTDKGKCPGGPRAEAFVVASPGGAAVLSQPLEGPGQSAWGLSPGRAAVISQGRQPLGNGTPPLDQPRRGDSTVAPMPRPGALPGLPIDCIALVTHTSRGYPRGAAFEPCPIGPLSHAV
jgi:hypothetical protein